MGIVSSFKLFFTNIRRDRNLRTSGIRFGWYLRKFYAYRLRLKLKSKHPLLKAKLYLNNKYYLTNMMPVQLGCLYSVFGDLEYDLHDHLTKSPQRILDFGANSGMAMTFFHSQYPNAKIACVEPDPRNIELLKLNIQENNLSNLVTVIPSAIDSEPGQLKFIQSVNSTLSGLENSSCNADIFKESGAIAVEVDVTTTPAVLEKLGWDHVDLLKIDIEGSEDRLLSQKNDWLSKVDAIVLEIHPNTTPEKIQSYIQPFGFKLVPLNLKTEPVYFASKTL